ncbi:MAG: SDR family oxidoreductase [Pseudomonadota bacterium]
MDLGLVGARVIVTAGAGGIGRGVADAFLAEGARVELCDVDQTALAGLPEGLTGTSCDVTDRAGVAAFVEGAVARLGGLDILINNAGIAGPTGPVEEIAPEDWDRCVAVCLTGQFNLARLAIPHLRQSDNASIVNVSSAAGKCGFPLRSAYAAAKWGVIGFTKSLAMELGPDRIRVNALLPGIVAGDRIRRVMEAKAQRRGVSFAEVEAEMFSYTSIPDYVTPEQLAAQVLFLSSRHGATISGQAVSVCGDTKMLA